jgi:hypothetical protein
MGLLAHSILGVPYGNGRADGNLLLIGPLGEFLPKDY